MTVITATFTNCWITETKNSTVLNMNKLHNLVLKPVLHCNAVEYYHEPVVGNVLQKPLREWWTDDRWEEIRRKGTGWCRVCPMAHHITIRLK